MLNQLCIFGTACASNTAGIDDCTPGSCANDGHCEDGHQSFTCNCEGTGFTGETCEIGKRN